MRSIILTGLLLLTATFSFAQDNCEQADPFCLKGKLVQRPASAPACGILAMASFAVFEVISFSDDRNNNNLAPVILTCPGNVDTTFWQIGKVYELDVIAKNPSSFGWTIMEAEILEEYEIWYWLDELVKVPETSISVK